MAPSKNGILGDFSGKIGLLVSYRLGDKFFIRYIPKAAKKFTTKELINQEEFKMVQHYLAPL